MALSQSLRSLFRLFSELAQWKLSRQSLFLQEWLAPGWFVLRFSASDQWNIETILTPTKTQFSYVIFFKSWLPCAFLPFHWYVLNIIIQMEKIKNKHKFMLLNTFDTTLQTWRVWISRAYFCPWKSSYIMKNSLVPFLSSFTSLSGFSAYLYNTNVTKHFKIGRNELMYLLIPVELWFLLSEAYV